MKGPIIVDGDSVALGLRQDVTEDKTWGYLLGKSRGTKVVNVATLEGTVGTSLGKLSAILDHIPSWYISQHGQWCLFRRGGPDKFCVEPSPTFERNYCLLIEALQKHDVQVCLVTPPPQPYHPGFARDVRDYLRVLRQLTYQYKIPLLDAHNYMAEDILYAASKEEVKEWFDNPDTGPLHYSPLGHKMVAGYFDLPENQHIGA